MRTKNYIFSFAMISVFVILLKSCPPKLPEPPIPPIVETADSGLLRYGGDFYKTAALFAKAYMPKSDTFEEGATYNQVDRLAFTWGSRLYPDGDCQRAARAINDYVHRYDKYSVLENFMTTFNPEWVCVGPKGNPAAGVGGNQYGVGQMHRITFDPKYDGATNTTIYATSSYGGLWKTTNDGANWFNLNTDFLPFCSVADVCINPKKTNQIFIATGYADDGFAARYDPNWAHANPIFTIGIYRSDDGGATWNPINNGFQSGFTDGGTCRRININPKNPEQVFVATTRGIYKCENATSTTNPPSWKIVLPSNITRDLEFRGLEFNPKNPSVVYASGIDIYKSNDGGNNWRRMTGAGTGFDFKDDPIFTVKRINITVTPADTSRLYAYVEGYKVENGMAVDGCKILMFKDSLWQVINAQYNSDGGTNSFTSGYIGIAVSPIDANQIYFGNTIVWGSDNYPTLPFSLKANYFSSTNFHADVHDLKFQPLKSGNPKLFCAHHGGISVKTIPASPAVQGWESRSEGLSVATIWAFDDGDALSTFAMTAHQDCGTNIYQGNTSPNKWTHIKGGDGYSARVDNANPKLAFFSGGKTSFHRFESTGTAFTTTYEYGQLPKEVVNPGTTLDVPKTFPMVNHPTSGIMFFGFTEVYERLKVIPSTTDPSSAVWNLYSNLNQTINEAWKRQITELVISPSNPDIFYVATGGQQNEPSSSWQLESTLFKGNPNASNPTAVFLFNEKVHPGKNVSPTKLAIITGIAVDPLNANRIWITYTGYWDQYKVWYSGDGGTSWVNADPRHDLFNIPVNAIVYQEGTNDRLFIGTDAGVYMSEKGGKWQKFGYLPNVRVTEMKINKSINKLRVATYGRGLWEGSLPPL